MLIAFALCLYSAGAASAWGRGGGFRAGGYRAGGVAVGGARVGVVGGARVGVVGGARVGAVGGARVGTVGAVGGYRGIGGVHAPLATDFGFGRVAGYGGVRGYAGVGHYTRAYSGGAIAARGAAVRGGYYRYGAFNTGWWGARPAAWRPVGWNAGRVWGWSTWPVLTGWFGWTAAPVYYDFGTTIVYQGDQVFNDNQPGPTAAVYYQQAADLAVSAPVNPPAEDKEDVWQPLGVFSLVHGDQTDTNDVFQLAVNKAGIIRGNYYNVLTDTTLPVRGAVDKTTQRASWIVGDKKTTVYDTGIANLTKDESPVLIHFDKDRTQQWLLVRVKESDVTTPEGSDPADVSPPATADLKARIIVIVPADADVYFDGQEMTQTGSERQFVTPPLEKGMTYNYSIRAVWTEDGRPIERTRKVTFQAGSQLRVDLTTSP
jgi:uncharacterized protein (TIGR03000 family)